GDGRARHGSPRPLLRWFRAGAARPRLRPMLRRLSCLLITAAVAAGLGGQTAGAARPPQAPAITRHAVASQMHAAQARMPRQGVRAAVAHYYAQVGQDHTRVHRMLADAIYHQPHAATDRTARGPAARAGARGGDV